ncbi:hypothetical protein SAMN04488564_106260 [Lentzea waywayandensis]|uniref:Secreted protein n=1 Tax=Lentzea waywayandensis TaxID=84724 RepID=A0A1I6EYC3_9PSEU|nr:hypothetical protein [Lentzea waywayandensis]SFR22597.1 hypothetical protein SAMN04488564_106260 [Lentzea waywayandensis]
MRLIAATAVALTVVTAAPAFAANPPGTASAGSADFAKADQTFKVAPLAVCDVNPDAAGTVTGASPAVSRTGLKIGETGSTCTTEVVNPDEFLTKTKSAAKGAGFDLSALAGLSGGNKGPRLKIAEWSITCEANEKGTSAGWELKGMSGWTGLPQQLPSGYVHDIKASNGTVLAKAKFTDTVFPVPNDGSIAMTLLKITFEPSSGYTGSITVGTVACSPTP